jgi:hypothetical protein
LSEAAERLRGALRESGYRVGAIEGEGSFLAESPERVVWATVFATPQQLIGSWQEVQADAIARTEALGPQKSWELYLLLGSELDAGESEEAPLDAIRRDTSYARKVLVLGLAGSQASFGTYLAPLMPLKIASPTAESADALSQLDDLVEAEGDDAERAVLAAFRSNRPLFGGL